MDDDDCNCNRCEVVSSEDEYEEMEEEMLNILCLFCSEHFVTFEQTFDHIKTVHQIDFLKCCSSSLSSNVKSQFDYIKLINYIRKNQTTPEQLEEVIVSKLFASGGDSGDDSYLKPTLQDDCLLMFDYDNDDGDDNDNDKIDAVTNTINTGQVLKNLSDFEQHYKNESKEKVIQDLYLLKQKYDELSGNVSRFHELVSETFAHSSQSVPSPVSTLNENTDSDYIDSYTNISIHHEMLSDRPRTLAYRDAIIENINLFNGKTVLDIGCGTGILSFFAAKAGARVIAIDQSDIVYDATAIIAQNGLINNVRTVKGKLETLNFAAQNLPTKYDIIISEWMGYFLLFEGMIDTILYARDHLLKPLGTLMPNRSKLLLAAFSDDYCYGRYVDFWKNVYGINMDSIIDKAVSEAIVDTIAANSVCSTAQVITDIDLHKCSLHSVQQVCSDFVLKIGDYQNSYYEQPLWPFPRKEPESNNDVVIVHGFVGWFDCHFELPNPITLSTSPAMSKTHWKQTLFFFQKPITMKKGETLNGTITINRSSVNIRALTVKIYVKNIEKCFNYQVR